MNGIFISYRRQDSEWVSGLIYDRLAAHFGPEAIFTDIDSIPLGHNFKIFIDEQVGKCDIFLAIIGEKWLNVTDDDNRLRLEQPEDFVRLEIESALKRKIPVIPLLVGDVEMPPADRLPKSLRELALRNGTMIRPKPTFDSDVERLIRGIEKQISMQIEAEPAPADKTVEESQRQRAAVEHKAAEEQIQRAKAERRVLVLQNEPLDPRRSRLPKWMAKNWPIWTSVIGLTVALIMALLFWIEGFHAKDSKPSEPGVYLQLDVKRGVPLRLDHLLHVPNSELDPKSLVGWCLKDDRKKYTRLDDDDVGFCSE